MKLPRIVSPLSVARIAKELARLNDNVERYMDHRGVPRRGEPVTSSQSLYVGESLSELEQALKEHAELTGQEWERTDE